MKSKGRMQSLVSNLKKIFSGSQKSTPLEPETLEQKAIASHMVEVYRLDAIDVAIPRADIIAIEVSASMEDISKILFDYPHSYYPVYRNTLDNLLGFFAVRDLIERFNALDTFVLREHIREAIVVAPTTSVVDVLQQMRTKKHRIALVVDEYGGVDGIITAEDIVQEVIGSLEEDISHRDYLVMEEREDGSLLVGARVLIKELEDVYGPIFSKDIEDTDIDTLGGLVFFYAGYIPSRHEIISHPSGIEFEIAECTSRFITRLIIRNLPTKLQKEENLSS
jgi:magnesium and cobalt transporter